MDERITAHKSLLPTDASTIWPLPPTDVAPPMARYFIGVDPGQSIDPTALAVVSVTRTKRPIYRCGHLERLPLNTPYPSIAVRVKELLVSLGGNSTIILDLTGVGRPVNDLFKDRGIKAMCVTITAGHEEVETQPGYFSVPKITLISQVQSLLHDGRLQIQKDLPETPALVSELQDFKATVTDSGRWTFGARSGAHDDLVLALSLACWASRRERRPPQITNAMIQRAKIPGRVRRLGSPW